MQQLGFAYIAKKGLSLEADYPYKAKDGMCYASRVKPAASVSGFKNIKRTTQPLSWKQSQIRAQSPLVQLPRHGASISVEFSMAASANIVT